MYSFGWFDSSFKDSLSIEAPKGLSVAETERIYTFLRSSMYLSWAAFTFIVNTFYYSYKLLPSLLCLLILRFGELIFDNSSECGGLIVKIAKFPLSLNLFSKVFCIILGDSEDKQMELDFIKSMPQQFTPIRIILPINGEFISWVKIFT